MDITKEKALKLKDHELTEEQSEKLNLFLSHIDSGELGSFPPNIYLLQNSRTKNYISIPTNLTEEETANLNEFLDSDIAFDLPDEHYNYEYIKDNYL